MLLFGAVWLLLKKYSLEFMGLPDVEGPQLLNRLDPTGAYPWLLDGANFLLLMNFMWSVLNLLPVIPLDGGQVVRAACRGYTSPSGMRFALGVSFVSAGIIAIYSFLVRSRPELWYPEVPAWATLTKPGIKPDPFVCMIFFAIMAVQSFIMMQSIKRQERPWLEEEREREW